MAKAKYDWEAIEKDYRLGQLSVRAISKKYGVSHSLIVKNAKEHGWTRNLTKQVNDLTRVGLIKGNSDHSDHLVTTPTREDIEAAALTNIQVINHHRSDIRKGRELVYMLMGQLSDAATSRDEIEDTVLSETEEDQTSARRTAMLKAISLPSHANTLRDLSTTLKNLIPLERQAYNITDEEEKDSFDDRLEQLARSAIDV